MFITQGPVDPENPLFVGREAELKQMESWLAHVRCVGSVLGARQTGKTSLLLKLRHCFRDKYAFAFVNFEGIVGANVTKCYSYIAEELLEQLADVIIEMDHPLPSDNRGFLPFLRTLSRNSRTVRIVVLLDEVGALPTETAIKLAHSIRAVFTNRLLKQEYGRYAFILSGATDMLELTTKRTSPLKNVTESVYLGDLTEEETRLLLARGLAQAGIDPSPTLYGHAYHWTNGHPYLTQLVGALLIESGQAPTEETMQAVIEQVLQNEDKNLPHIRRALDNGRPELWNTVKSIIRAPVPFSRSNDTVAELELIGAIRNEAGQCQIRNNLYREAMRGWLMEGPHLSLGGEPIQAISLRLNHLADNVRQDLALLKDYEDELRYVRDPRDRAKYRREIKRLRESVARYQQQYDKLWTQVTGEQSVATHEMAIQLQRIAAQLQQMDARLDALPAIRDDLTDLRRAVLVRFEVSEQTIIAAIVERLDQSQLDTVQAVLDTVEAGRVPESELQETLAAVQHALSEMQQQGVALSDATLASEVERLSEVIDAPKLDVKHKLKITAPIIPWILSYEGEIELKSGLNLKAAWQRLVAKVRGGR